jgi:chitodextrinase
MDTMSGTAEMRFSNDNITYTEWQAYATSKTWNLSEGDGSKIVYVQFKDHLGLVSTCSDTIVLDTAQPTGTVTIAGGRNLTNSTSVMLIPSAHDNTSGVAQMRFSNDSVTWSDWEAYATSKTWSLLPGDGVKFVNVQYRDNAGLTSSCNDSIILDTTKPVANVGAYQPVYAGRLVNFDASASTDENGLSTYTWTFIDVTTKTLTGEKPNYNFTNPGVYTITLEIVDFAGNSAINATTVTILKIPKPIANAGQNQTARVGATVSFNASASRDEVRIVSFQWDFGDGTGGTGEIVTHTYAKPGNYTVTLTVENEFGNSDTSLITVAVVSEGTPTWMISVIIAAIALFTGILAMVLWKKRITSIHTIFSSRKA